MILRRAVTLLYLVLLPFLCYIGFVRGSPLLPSSDGAPQQQEQLLLGMNVAINRGAFNNCLIDVGKRVLDVTRDKEIDKNNGHFYKEVMHQEPCVNKLLNDHPVPGLHRQGRQDESVQQDLSCFFCPVEVPEELYLNFAKCFTGTDTVCCMCIVFTSANIAIAFLAMTG